MKWARVWNSSISGVYIMQNTMMLGRNNDWGKKMKNEGALKNGRGGRKKGENG